MKPSVLVCAIFALACTFTVAADDRLVTVLTVSRAIDPITARYVIRGLDRARRDGSTLAVIELDTPGGLGSAMEQIVGAILTSPVPVVVFVGPPGARAASAGVFIAAAAQVVVMAPGTHIGAAHPVDSSGKDIEGAMGEKVLNDTLATLRSLIRLRGRDPAWAEDAVRRSLSLTETEAVQRKVADVVAPDLGALLAAVDG
ncbi:MAG TPA: nodulation protein NfeD, partial [Spirochaetia bacterium]